MDDMDRDLLNILQADFPLTPAPFQAIGLKLSIPEGQVIDRIRSLKERKIVRQIGAIFDSRRLGFVSALVAMKIPPDVLDAAAQVINQHPGVSHNYARHHEFNLWFTLTLPRGGNLQQTVDHLSHQVGAHAAVVLPALKIFKIGVNLDMVGGTRATRTETRPPKGARETPAKDLTPEDFVAIGAMEQDLPLVPKPFEALARRVGMEEGELIVKAKEFLAGGEMRRFAAVLHHREAGFRANAMGVWRVPEERSDEVGAIIASFSAVSHCYQRPSFAGFPYNLYSMVHGRNARECQGVLEAISKASGITEYIALYSTKEYKKTRVKYAS